LLRASSHILIQNTLIHKPSSLTSVDYLYHHSPRRRLSVSTPPSTPPTPFITSTYLQKIGLVILILLLQHPQKQSELATACSSPLLHNKKEGFRYLCSLLCAHNASALYFSAIYASFIATA
ncbi:hypothetical protein KSS87_014250, partial [Heliosperma pusillum]